MKKKDITKKVQACLSTFAPYLKKMKREKKKNIKIKSEKFKIFFCRKVKKKRKNPFK